MANTFITLKTIARQALPRLIENLVFPNLVHKDFSDDFGNLGDTIRVRKPVILTASEFDASQGIQPQDMQESTVEVKLDKLATVDAQASAIETAVNIDDLNRLFIEPAAVALAEKINSDGLALYADVPSMVDCSTKNVAALANVRKALNEQKVPTAGRVAVWDPVADAAFTQLDAVLHAEKSGSTAALREGSIGRVFGIEHYMAQGVKQHAATITATAPKVNGAVTKGATSIAIDGTALSGKLLKGDVLTIGGNAYTVTEETAEASSNAIATVKIYPAAVANIADNADVTISSGYTANLAFNPMAFAYVTRPLYNPDGEGVASYVTSYNGISLRVTKGYNQTYKKSVYSMDVLYGYKCIYPELAVRCLG
jgi:hypothetical protein